MKEFKFKHYIARMAINRISVAAYYNEKENTYKLVVERSGYRIKGSYCAYLTEDEYEDLPDSTYSGTRRFLAAAALCGVTFFKNKSINA